MEVIQCFSNLNIRNLHWLNTSNIVLIPKKEGAEDISDFRPISLICRLCQKILSRCLPTPSPRMNDIVSHSQSAFIKSTRIHNNFIFLPQLREMVTPKKEGGTSLQALTLWKLSIMFVRTTSLIFFNALDFHNASSILSRPFFAPLRRESS
jgi:hypothetical protein